MNPHWEKTLERWVGAGLVDAAMAERIRAYETEQARHAGLRWPVLLALAFGGLTLGAGVLLFVAAHWDQLSPAARYSLVLLLVAVFHVAGALLADRFSKLATVMHALGTVALGAGIFMAGQIFNLEEHWPGGLMLWAAGAWIGWAVVRDWPQALLAALLTPSWLTSEWMVATEHDRGSFSVAAAGLLLLAITFVSARDKAEPTLARRALAILGGLALVPCTALVLTSSSQDRGQATDIPRSLLALGWASALLLPLALAYVLRGRAAWINGAMGVWVVALTQLPAYVGDRHCGYVFSLFWCAAGAAALVAWGAFEEQRELLQIGLAAFAMTTLGVLVWTVGCDRITGYVFCAFGSSVLVLWGSREKELHGINLGFLAFGITVMTFYFSNVMDKLGRSASLMGLGGLLLVSGWGLEKMRRRMVGHVKEDRA